MPKKIGSENFGGDILILHLIIFPNQKYTFFKHQNQLSFMIILNHTGGTDLFCIL